MNDKIINKLVWGYVIGVVVYHGLYILEIYNDPEQELSFLALNDLGDFLSGFFAPIAFVYLYKSYKQLQEQLKIANQTLEEQKKQAKESEKQLKKQIEITQKQMEISVFPILSTIKGRDKDNNIINLKLKNLGEPVYIIIHSKYDKKNTLLPYGRNKMVSKDSAWDIKNLLNKFLIKNKDNLNKDIESKYEFVLIFRTKLYANYSMDFKIIYYYDSTIDKFLIKDAFLITKEPKKLN